MEKKEHKKVQNGPKNSIPEHFIPYSINPDNGTYYGERNNPLCSKGNSVIAEDYGTFLKGGPKIEEK